MGAVGDWYDYECGAGHPSGAPRPLTRCPVCIKGKPCEAPLELVGGTGAGKTAHQQQKKAGRRQPPAVETVVQAVIQDEEGVIGDGGQILIGF